MGKADYTKKKVEELEKQIKDIQGLPDQMKKMLKEELERTKEVNTIAGKQIDSQLVDALKKEFEEKLKDLEVKIQEIAYTQSGAKLVNGKWVYSEEKKEKKTGEEEPKKEEETEEEKPKKEPEEDEGSDLFF